LLQNHELGAIAPICWDPFKALDAYHIFHYDLQVGRPRMLLLA
jgi:hypothetical protein